MKLEKAYLSIVDELPAVVREKFWTDRVGMEKEVRVFAEQCEYHSERMGEKLAVAHTFRTDGSRKVDIVFDPKKAPPPMMQRQVGPPDFGPTPAVPRPAPGNRLDDLSPQSMLTARHGAAREVLAEITRQSRLSAAHGAGGVITVDSRVMDRPVVTSSPPPEMQVGDQVNVNERGEVEPTEPERVYRNDRGEIIGVAATDGSHVVVENRGMGRVVVMERPAPRVSRPVRSSGGGLLALAIAQHDEETAAQREARYVR